MLYEKHARYGELVKACSPEAVKQGVRPGMPLAEAQTLMISEALPQSISSNSQVAARTALARSGIRKNSEAKSHYVGSLATSATSSKTRPRQQTESPHYVPHDAHCDRETLTKLAEWCERFSPTVGLDQTDEPDCLLMDISGLTKLFGGEEAMACTVVKAFRKRGFEVRIAVADTIGAARAVARFVIGHDHRPYKIVPSGDKKTLDTVPVAALRLPTRTMGQLKRLGIDTIGQLRQLPRSSLAARFKEDLIEGLDRIVGGGQEVIVSHKRAAELAARWSFEHVTTHRGAIGYVFEQLLHQLSRRLIEQGQGVLQLECRLVCKSHQPLVINVGLFQPSVNPQHLLGLIEMQLERLILPDAVEEIHVIAVSTAPREQRQSDLFASGSRDDQSKLALLVERLSSRLGRDRVARAQLQAEPQVELAYRRVPLTGEQTPTGPHGPASILGPMLRPLRIFDPPEPVGVIGIALDGPPAMFRYRRKQYRVARHFGPERIETGWWRGPSSRRDYYRVETEAGNRMWLFRKLQDKKWFLHGEFV